MHKKLSGRKKREILEKDSIPKKNGNPSIFLLKMLLSAAPNYLSGSDLAKSLNMSRVGVWARITKLREAGLIIEASQNRGYRLSAEPKRCNQSLLEALLLKAETKCKIFVHDTIDSTNSEAERLLANGEKGPFAVISNHQSNGRGRRGQAYPVGCAAPRGGALPGPAPAALNPSVACHQDIPGLARASAAHRSTAP